MPDSSQHKIVQVTSLGGFLDFYECIIYTLAGYVATSGLNCQSLILVL